MLLSSNTILWLAYLCLLLFCLYIWITKKYDYWRRQNISFVKPYPLLGSITLDCFKKPLHTIEKEWYDAHGRVYGRFEGPNPVLSIGNPEMLTKVFVKDFHIFPNRRDMKFHDPIMDNTLFILEGDDWSRVRNIMTPNFTTKKLKLLFKLLSECCDTLTENFSQATERSETIDCLKYFENFVLYTIGRSAFGIKIHDLENPQNAFSEKARKLLQESYSWRTLLILLCPTLMKIFRVKLLNPETTIFYKDLIVEVIAERKNLKKNQVDFLKFLMEHSSENINEDSNNNGENTVCPRGSCRNSLNTKTDDNRLSRDELLSQCVTFFIAGFEPTTAILMNVFYHLAKYPHYQQRVFEEMQESIEKHKEGEASEVTYEAVSDLKFTDAFLDECLRLCPAMARHERRCGEDYYFEDQNIVLKKGMLVSIPVYAMHRDPEWYPEPDVFKPERFLKKDNNRPEHAYLPFGKGRRICVGMRFVKLQVKLCLTKVLTKFQILPSPTMPDTLEVKESRNVLRPANIEVCLKDRA